MSGRILKLALGACLMSVPGVAAADEGLWTFDNFPFDKMKAAYGFAPDQAFLDRLRLGSGRYADYCSGGIVSPQGLVQTNHHCVQECQTALMPAGADPADTAIVAATLAEERQCPGLTFQVLTGIVDVTAEIDAATAGLAGDDLDQRLDDVTDRIVDACEGNRDDRICELNAFHGGAERKLYAYKQYDDVRMVLATELAVEYFGGYGDAFGYPRYSLDVSFVRLYENGKPAATPDGLKWRSEPMTLGEPLFIPGSPAWDARTFPVARVKYIRDALKPLYILLWGDLRGRLVAFSERGPEERRAAALLLYNIENSLRSDYGELAVLGETASMHRLEAAEADLRARIAADPSLAEQVGDAWTQYARIEERERMLFRHYRLLEADSWGLSVLLDHARELVRAAADVEEDGEGEENGELEVPESVTEDGPVVPRIEELTIAFWLGKTQEILGAYDPVVKKALGKESPAQLAARLVAGTRLGDAEFRRKLVEGGAEAVMASDDPMLVFVGAFDADVRAIADRFQAEVRSPRDTLDAKVARARLKLFGNAIHPETNFTPRVSYGAVEGWTEPNGETVPPFTTFGGLKDLAATDGPFKLAASWQRAIDTLSPDTILNVTTNHDTLGGNSGSPVVDREGRVVGALFDGNYPGLAGSYFFDPAANRSVVVASTAIEEALIKIYGLQRIVDELKR